MKVETSEDAEIADAATAEHDPYAALRISNFRLYVAGNALAILGGQMQTVAVGWEIYERTGSAMALGIVGLIQFLPVALLTLPAGHEADRSHRKVIVMCGMLSMAACSLGLAWISWRKADVGLMYLCLMGSGIARAFLQPAKASMLPQIVPRSAFTNAVTWNMGGFQLAAILGPAFGGQAIAYYNGCAVAVYLLDAACTLTFFVFLWFVRTAPFTPSTETTSYRSHIAGLTFVWANKVILAAMTLDMFAVLLGGAVMLLPIYASEEMLNVGPGGLGWMRTSPALGALLTSLVITHRPPIERAGRTLLVVVVGFGLATIVFGLSRSYALSLAMLFFTGAFDIVSVVIRHTLVQLLTPDQMRGRVSAVNSMFIGASNELGGFESGLVAAWFGPTFSVVSGGVGTLVVVGVVALAWPQLGRYGRLDGK